MKDNNRPLALKILEQVSYTGSQFYMQMALLKILGLSEFGKFSAIYAVTILLSAIHTSIFVDPLLSINKNKNTLSILKADIPLIILATAICGAYLITNESLNATTLTSAVIFNAGYILWWSLRGNCLIENTPLKPVFVGLAQCSATTALLTYHLTSNLPIDLETCLSILGLSTLLTALLSQSNFKTQNTTINAAWLSFGASTLTTQILVWSMTNGASLILSVTGKDNESALLRIFLTIALPMQYIALAISNHYLPILSQTHSGQGWTKAARQYTKKNITIALLYTLAIAITTSLTGFFYPKIAQELPSIYYYIAIPLILIALTITRTILKSLRKPEISALSAAIGVVFFLTIVSTITGNDITYLAINTGLAITAAISIICTLRLLRILGLYKK